MIRRLLLIIFTPFIAAWVILLWGIFVITWIPFGMRVVEWWIGITEKYLEPIFNKIYGIH